MNFDDLAAAAPDNPARLEEVSRRASSLRRRRALVRSGAGTAVLAVAAVGVLALLPGHSSGSSTQLVPAASAVPSPEPSPLPVPTPCPVPLSTESPVPTCEAGQVPALQPSPVPGPGLQTVPAPVPAPSLPLVVPCVFGITGPVYVAATPAPRYVAPCPVETPAGQAGAVPQSTQPSPIAPPQSSAPLPTVSPLSSPVAPSPSAAAGSSYTG